ncbi:CocE/NonD family hydrolase [Nitrococcus mobilis]|uniref:Peptidase S15 n=1 Tax=Nitrococcus mobilis Nb-231 TaxID=314278 RepID=A4BTL4_9GAMM|nr:CocE/NonD family hydrolase [Nitrococcus mobilis]EAR20970.1 Peptidase S15 [Nitrococcus mobilis Nb-231]
MEIMKSFPRQVRVIENLWIPLSDGCRLAARIWLPADAETHPVPAILEYIPYRKRDFTRLRDEPLHHYFAGHGYASIRLDLRGSGDSDGVLRDEYLRQEQDDAVEAIAWIAAQPWCSGELGMIGISWGGFNALQVAARQPPPLKAIITLCSTDDRYADDAHYMGGCLLNENLTWGSVLLSYNAYPPDPKIVGERWRDMWRQRLEQAVLFPEIWLHHQQRDDYWKHGSVCEDFSAIACPVYAIGGWADGYTSAIPRLMEGLEVPRKALVGPWSHALPHDALPGPSIGFFQEAIRWWDHWLKGLDTGVMDEPMYRAWMQEWVPPAPFYEERPGRWVAEDSWPSSRIRHRRWYLDVHGLRDEPGAELQFTLRSPQTTGLGAGDWCGFGGEGEMPADQREDDGKSLVFDTEALEKGFEILGAPVVTLELAVDRPIAFVAVRLNDVAPDGAAMRVTYGVLNLTHRDSHEHARPLEPGRRYRVSVQLNDIAHAFPAGHIIRVAVSTSYWPVVWPAPQPITLSVFTAASWLDLPVRPPRPEDEALHTFERPARAPAPEHTPLRMTQVQRTLERDLTSNETVYTTFSDGGDFAGASLAHLPDIDLVVGYTIRKIFRIQDDDPLSARAQIEQQTVLRRSGWATRIDCHTELFADREAFRIRARLECYEEETRFFSRQWDRKIKRRLV